MFSVCCPDPSLLCYLFYLFFLFTLLVLLEHYQFIALWKEPILDLLIFIYIFLLFIVYSCSISSVSYIFIAFIFSHIECSFCIFPFCDWCFISDMSVFLPSIYNQMCCTIQMILFLSMYCVAETHGQCPIPLLPFSFSNRSQVSCLWENDSGPKLFVTTWAQCTNTMNSFRGCLTSLPCSVKLLTGVMRLGLKWPLLIFLTSRETERLSSCLVGPLLPAIFPIIMSYYRKYVVLQMWWWLFVTGDLQAEYLRDSTNWHEDLEEGLLRY